MNVTEHAPGNAATESQRVAERSVTALYESDTAAHALGIRIDAVAPGTATLSIHVREDMVNGHGVCHGGFIFAVADTAFAYACNSYGEAHIAVQASVDFVAPGRLGDTLTATANEAWRSGRTGLYEVRVANQHGDLIALFRGRSQRLRAPVHD